MPHAPGKFCIDRNLVRWNLLNGMISRKTINDGPLDGQEVAASRVTAIEPTTFKKVERQPYGRAMILIGVALLGLAWWSLSLPLRVIFGLFGLLLVYGGVERSRSRVTIYDAFRIVIPGQDPAEWTVVGSTPEVMGIVEGIQAEMYGETNALGASSGNGSN
jgi:hypothetical protein